MRDKPRPRNNLLTNPCASTLSPADKIFIQELQHSFSRLPESVRQLLLFKIWEAAGKPDSESGNWAGEHTFENMELFHAVLNGYAKKIFYHLTPEQRQAVYFHVYQLAKEDGVDVSQANWGERHAPENLPRLIHAIAIAQGQGSTSFQILI